MTGIDLVRLHVNIQLFERVMEKGFKDIHGCSSTRTPVIFGLMDDQVLFVGEN